MKMRKRILQMTIVAWAAMCAAFPAFAADITGLSGSAGANSKEGFQMLFDDTTATKWCTLASRPYVIFESSSEKPVSGYAIVTANDNNRYKRNPLSWTLYGCNAAAVPEQDSGQWEVIDQVTDDTVLQNVNFTEFRFSLSGQVPAYQYYMFQVDKKSSQFVQMSEFRLIHGDGGSYAVQTTIGGSGWMSVNEKASNLSDKDLATKWCVGGQNPYAIFRMSSPLAATGYNIVTANDNSQYPGRNPASWTLYGCNCAAEPDSRYSGWEVVHQVADDITLQDVNYTTYHFDISGTVPAYEYYMLWIDKKKSNLMQMSEFTILGNGASSDYANNAGNGSSSGNTGGQTMGQLMCGSCAGRGENHCFVCNGNGRNGSGEKCANCDGMGKVRCTACGGRGFIQ